MVDDAKPLGPEAQFKAYLAEGRFMIQRSRSTGRHVFYPRIAVPGGGETDLEWVAASGDATIYDLAEGPRMMSRIEGVETAPMGARVKARIAALDGEPALVFDLADGVPK
jgi:uncharacterized OB-fold protein